MREIVLDTETTGFKPEEGHRIVEIGALELLNHLPTGKTFHVYINPEREMPTDAFKVHGLGDEFLADKPKFAEVAQDFLDFVQDSRMIIHNAKFDMTFLNAELGWANLPKLPMSQSFDTVQMARKKYPGSPASLDALCRRFGVDNSNRTLHGALLDSELLAEVYLELLGGRQPDFQLDAKESETSTGMVKVGTRPNPLPSRIHEAERAAHEAFIQSLPDAKWLN